MANSSRAIIHCNALVKKAEVENREKIRKTQTNALFHSHGGLQEGTGGCVHSSGNCHLYTRKKYIFL